MCSLLFVWVCSCLFICPLVLLCFPNFVYSLHFFFWVWCCLFYSFGAPSSFCHLHFITVSCHFISFCFGMLLSFLGCSCILFIHWYFFVFPPLSMIVFHCSVFFLCLLGLLFWSFACSGVWLHFIVVCVLCYLLGMLLSFLFLHGSFHLINQMNSFCCICLTSVFSFRCTVVFLFLHHSFSQSNEWCFIAVF